MPAFAYKGKAPDGNVVQGIIEAAEQRAAIDRLRQQKLVILEINQQAEGGFSLKKLLARKGKVTSKDLVLFSRQLSTLISAGVPIVQGLAILAEQASNPAFRKIIEQIRMDIEGGLSISDALKKHPRAFPTIYTSMIHAGEVGGILDTILERLSSYLESSEALKAKVKSAMMYPAIVMSICALVTLFLLTFVIPTFKNIFASFGAELPIPTQIIIDISDFLRQYWYIVPLTAVGVWFGIKKFHDSPYGRKMIDRNMLKMPIFGILIKKFAVAKFSRTLGTLIKSGVPIMQGLDTVAATSGNVIIEAAIIDARDSIREGGRLADPLRKSNLFPPMVTQMIKVGEETGALDTMLTKIADFYDQEVDAAVKGLTSMIEPVVIVIMGLVIGFIVIAMFLPMFGLGELASKEG